MSVADEIVAISSGARFYRADMHIHSFGGSHDVKDSSMTPEKIVETAVAEGLGVIAITDHNEIHNVSALLTAASGRILAVPGVELSTPEGHLLVYFEDLNNLVEYYGRLTFAGKGTENSRCQTSMLECIQRIQEGRGFAILAHVDGSGGLEDKVRGYPPHKADILASRALLGIELQAASSQVSYSPYDNEPERAAIGKQRIDKLKLGQKQFLARVLFSDSHNLQALGRNAQGNRKVTRIKMDSPSFHGLRIALEDSDARIRLEDEIPASVPYVLGVKLEGGFLDGQLVHLSRNLNCIIGGRGAGKSTVFETIRICSSHPSPSKNVDSEIWPENVRLVWVDQAGQQHTINKRAGMEPQNIDDPVLGPASCSIEAYGQNETAQTSSRAQSDPNALLEYLDQFIDFGAAKIDDEALREELLNNQTLIEKAQTEVAKIPEFRKLLANVQQQLQALEKAKAPEVVALERQVAEERSLRSNLERKISDLSIQAKHSNVLETLGEIRKLVPGGALKVGASEYSNVLSLIAAFEAHSKSAQVTLAEKAQILSDSAKKHLEQWRIREQQIVEQIEAKRKDLAAQGVRLDMAYIRKLATDEAGYKKSLETLLTWEPHLADLRKSRLELLKRRTLTRSRISTSRVAFGKKADLALKDALGDLSVSVKFAEAALSAQAEEVVQRAMNWRTVQVPRAPLLLDQVPLPQLLDCIKRNNPAPLLEVKTADGAKVFNKADALEILTKLKEQPYIFELERCQVDDRPRITITKLISEPGKQPRFVARDFSRLSLGQQQSVLLSLMLLSDSEYPLIIDQPEDNLDSEFIYHSLVPVLRRAKERRQVIVVTHNANIAVLGDAEQIIVLKSTSDKSQIVAKGSIDDGITKVAACQILEGSEEAFRRRAKTYGLLE